MKQLLLQLLLTTTLFASFVGSHCYPYDTEGIALGETGVAASLSPSSVFYNPANGALFGAENRVRVALSGGYGSLLPMLRIAGTQTNHQALYYYQPLRDSAFHMSVSAVSVIQKGLYDDHMVLDSSTHSLYLSGSISWKRQLSFGVSVQRYDSERRDTISYKASADNWIPLVNTIDLPIAFLSTGLRWQYHYKLKGGYLMKPSVGVAFHGLGSTHAAARYTDSAATMSISNPLYAHMRTGASCMIGKEYGPQATLLYDFDRTFDRIVPEFKHAIGLQLSPLPLLRLNGGFLLEANDRDNGEFHWGGTVGYRSHAMRQFLQERGCGCHREEMGKNVELLYSFSQIQTLRDYTERRYQRSHQLTVLFDWGR